MKLLLDTLKSSTTVLQNNCEGSVLFFNNAPIMYLPTLHSITSLKKLIVYQGSCETAEIYYLFASERLLIYLHPIFSQTLHA